MTSNEAYDALMGSFTTVWGPTGNPTVFPDLALDDATKAAIETGSTPWCRVTHKPNTRNQNTIGGPPNRVFLQTGISIFEVYTPSGDGGFASRTLCKSIEQTFEGISTPNGLWYRNVRTNNVGPDGHYWHANVIVEWQYDEVR